MEHCPTNLTGEEIYKMLMLNFKRHYLSNRAPLGLHFNSMWFRSPTNIYAFSVSELFIIKSIACTDLKSSNFYFFSEIY